MKRLMMVLAACGGLMAHPALAQQAGPSARTQELAARYVELMDLGQMMEEAFLGQQSLTDEAMTGMQGLGLPLKGDAATASPMPTFAPEGSLDALRPMIALMEVVMVQAVAETYPEHELEALVEFYDTPQGREILGRQATLQTRMTGIMLERMPEMMEAMGLGDMMDGLGGGATTAGAPTRSMTPMQPSSVWPAGSGDLVQVISEDQWLAEQAAAAGD